MRPIIPQDKMNGLERRHADGLWYLQRTKEILSYQFEEIVFILADRTTYRPDFFVTFQDHFEVHEIKGHMEDDAAVKLKVAAKQFPYFKFMLFKTNKRGALIGREIKP